MALTPYFGRDPLWTWGAGPLSTFDEFSSLLDAPVGSFMRETQAVANTAVDVKETPKEIVFTADMPGLRKEEVQVQVEEGNVLCISGERTREKAEQTDRYHRMERSMGRFQRRFRLPERTEVDKIKASVDRGVLVVTVPKAAPPPEHKEQPKQIAIE